MQNVPMNAEKSCLQAPEARERSLSGRFKRLLEGSVTDCIVMGANDLKRLA